MGLGIGEIGVIAAVLLGGATEILLPAALLAWALWVARGNEGPGWRIAIALPLVGVGTALAGVAVTALMVFLAFRGVASADPSVKAALLAEGISRATAATGIAVLLSWMLYLASAVLSGVGTVRAIRRRQPGENRNG